MQKRILYILICLLITIKCNAQQGITFCGQLVPIQNSQVSSKLKTIIRNQIPTSRMGDLRRKTSIWFPWLESQLQKYGLPKDLKYLPIVESQFKNKIRSQVGAAGLWQIMPSTATGLGLKLNPDEREDPVKATDAACKLLKDYGRMVKNWNGGKEDWALTCAAYNFGIGNIQKAIANKGNNYYTMDLNKETAAYVYKIIAIKELWEHPNDYMDHFNVETETPPEVKNNENDNNEENTKPNKVNKIKTDKGDINIELLDDIKEDGDVMPYDDSIYNLEFEPFDAKPVNKKVNESNKVSEFKKIIYSEVVGVIEKNKKKIIDGQIIKIKLDENLECANGDFYKKGTDIELVGKINKNKVMLTFNDDIKVFYNDELGVPLNAFKDDELIVILRVPKK